LGIFYFLAKFVKELIEENGKSMKSFGVVLARVVTECAVHDVISSLFKKVLF